MKHPIRKCLIVLGFYSIVPALNFLVGSHKADEPAQGAAISYQQKLDALEKLGLYKRDMTQKSGLYKPPGGDQNAN